MVSGVEVTSGPILRTIPAVLFVIKTLSLVTHSYSVYFVKKPFSSVIVVLQLQLYWRSQQP